MNKPEVIKVGVLRYYDVMDYMEEFRPGITERFHTCYLAWLDSCPNDSYHVFYQPDEYVEGEDVEAYKEYVEDAKALSLEMFGEIVEKILFYISW